MVGLVLLLLGANMGQGQEIDVYTNEKVIWY